MACSFKQIEGVTLHGSARILEPICAGDGKDLRFGYNDTHPRVSLSQHMPFCGLFYSRQGRADQIALGVSPEGQDLAAFNF